MKQKLLFIAPNYYGFCDVVLQGLQQYSGCDVYHIDSESKYQYKNIGERIYNFFSKTFCGKNIKITRKKQILKEKISQNNYDILVIIGAYSLEEDVLDTAISQTKHSISILWDSIAKIPSQKKYLNKFDTCYSFDKDDCEKYNLRFNPNFYFVEEQNSVSNYDISYLATYDDRITDTIHIINYFNLNHIKNKARILTAKNIKISHNLPKNIEIIHNIIPFSESYKYYSDSKIILDIAHSNQKGLSFRPFEAIGMNKKLITTNKDIVNYDFYNPNNIFVIDNIKNIDIPTQFLASDYEELTKDIKEKYHIKNWVKNILSSYSIQ